MCSINFSPGCWSRPGLVGIIQQTTSMFWTSGRILSRGILRSRHFVERVANTMTCSVRLSTLSPPWGNCIMPRLSSPRLWGRAWVGGGVPQHVGATPEMDTNDDEVGSTRLVGRNDATQQVLLRGRDVRLVTPRRARCRVRYRHEQRRWLQRQRWIWWPILGRELYWHTREDGPVLPCYETHE